MTKKVVVGVLFLGLLIVSAAQAEEMGYSQSKNKLKITTDRPTGGAWLGITFYPPAGKLFHF